MASRRNFLQTAFSLGVNQCNARESLSKTIMRVHQHPLARHGSEAPARPTDVDRPCEN
jgi:hypothetical protein